MPDVHAHLRALAEASPPGSMLNVPREWVLLVLGSGEPVASAADPTIRELAARFGRSPSTIRWWIESNRFPGAYRLRGREWRVPASGVAAFEAAERVTAGEGGADRKPPPVPATGGRPRRVDLGAWRRVG